MNIGGYDTNAFSESDGNRILGDILERSKKIKVHFAEGDKTPNFDGCFELCENSHTKMIPIGKFNVQIKTMSTDYRNRNQSGKKSDYKYSCETKVFNSVIKGISCDPAILFLVDITKKIVFYIHVSPEFALGLNLADEDHKTIYFNESDRLVDESFFAKLHKIYEGHRRKIYSEKESSLTISEELDSKTVEELQDIIDNFNNVFSNELAFIKHHFYPNVWKFGIAYIKNSDISATIGIYEVQRGENGVLIKKFSKENSSECKTISYYKLKYKTTREIIEGIMLRIIDDYFDKAFIDPAYLPTIVLEELSFYFLDAVASSCESYNRADQENVYFKDVVPVEEVSKLWSSLIEYAVESSPYLTSTDNNPEVDAIIMDPIESLESGFDTVYRRGLFESIRTRPTERRPSNISLILQGKFAYHLVKGAIEELEQRKVNSVSRIWAPQNFKESFKELEVARACGINRYETGFVLADFQLNLQRLFSELPKAYKQTSQNLFGKFSPVLEISKEYLIHVEPTFEAECIRIDLPSDELKISQLSDVNDVILTWNSFDSVKALYPNCEMVTKTYLWNAFSTSYPLYRNVSYLIKKSIYRYLNKDLPYSSGFHPIIH